MAIDIQKEILRFDPSLPLGRAKTPPASWYTHPEMLALEKHYVFQKHWQFVGRADQVSTPGAYFTGLFMGWPYVVTRAENGALNAFYNVCSHHGTCVAKGSGNGSEFVCPYHGWTYNLHGALKRAPRAGAIAELRTRTLDLKPIPVAEWGPLIALHFGTPDQDLTSTLSSLLRAFSKNPFANMNFVRRVAYSIPCNWKVFVDNYLDGGYHVPHMHPSLSDTLDLDSYTTTMGKHWSMQACGGQQDARVGDQADYAWAYPNFMLDRYGPWLNTIHVIPTDIHQCITTIDYYFEGAPDPDFLDTSLTQSDQVQQEDIEICKMVQTGLSSGVYDQGIYAPRFEGSMYQFHQYLFDDLRRETQP